MYTRRIMQSLVAVLLIWWFIFTLTYEFVDRSPTTAEWSAMGLGAMWGVLFCFFFARRWNPHNVAAYERTKASPAYRRGLVTTAIGGALASALVPRLLGVPLTKALLLSCIIWILVLLVYCLIKVWTMPLPDS